MAGQDEADDLAQDVFLKASQALDSFRGESQLFTWSYRIATNTAVVALKSASFRQSAAQIEFDENDNGSLLEIEISRDNPGSMGYRADDQLARKETNECIRSYIDRLPDTYRSVLVLSDLEDMMNRVGIILVIVWVVNIVHCCITG
jgi:RNA polymerase sigma-70 factor, ECF subfamily